MMILGERYDEYYIRSGNYPFEFVFVKVIL